jgi:citrate lyase subunit beta/citryl-CoA lyase
MNAQPLTWLYAPATRPERYAKALASGADVVILDLEDSVVPDRKDEARALVVDFLTDGGWRAGAAQVEVRVNPVGTPAGMADLRALAGVAGLRAVRLPRVDSPAEVSAADEALRGSQRLECLLESALGVESALAIAGSSPLVSGIGLGEADLTADLGLADAAGLTWSRSRIVVAARAAGLPAPAMSVYPAFGDDPGLAAHCSAGRRLGFLGCTAIHPRQLPVIEAAFLPTEEEIAAAKRVLAALASASGQGAARTEDGRMVDPAMRRRAEQVMALAARPRRPGA